MNAVLARLNALDRRVVWFAVSALALLVAAESWVFLFRGDLGELRRLRLSREELAQAVGDVPRLSRELARLTTEVEALQKQLYGDARGLSTGQQTVQLMGELDRIARRHDLTLKSVQPGRSERVMDFNETSYDIEAAGAYDGLMGWLADVEKELGPMVISRFSLRASGQPGAPLDLTLRLASYRPVEGTGKP